MEWLAFGLVAVPSDVSVLYVTVVLLETILAATLFALLAVAFHRRRSIPYFLLACAAGTILLRGVVGAIPMLTMFDPSVHILIDHGLDVILLTAALGAIHHARHASPTTQ